MTPKELALVILECAETGRPMQRRAIDNVKRGWVEPDGERVWFDLSSQEYRCAPESEHVPLGPDDCPCGTFVRRKRTACVSLVTQTDTCGFTLDNICYSWRKARKEGYEYSRDEGKTWNPMRKEVEE